MVLSCSREGMLKTNVGEEKDAIAFGLFAMITVNPTGIDKVRCAVRTVNVPICVVRLQNVPYLSMVTVPHKMVGFERTSDYRGVGVQRDYCMFVWWLQHCALQVNSGYTRSAHPPTRPPLMLQT